MESWYTYDNHMLNSILEQRDGAHQVRIYIADDADEEIERLRKEKEWLLNEHSFMKYGSSYNGLPTNHRDNMIKDMQKALREE